MFCERIPVVLDDLFDFRAKFYRTVCPVDILIELFLMLVCPRYSPFESKAMTKLIENLESNRVIEDDDGPWGAHPSCP